MNDMYRRINAKKVDSNFVILNHTDARVLNFDIWFTLSFGLLLIIQIFSYNSHTLIELFFTIFLIIVTLLISIYKKMIWYKLVVFNRAKGTITLKRNLPYTRETFNYSKIELIAKNKIISDDDSTYEYISYYIKRKYNDTKYKICETDTNHNFKRFITKYMNSNEYLLNNLVKYDKEKDEQLKKVYHI